ncbi:hypothetical protein [Nocardia sp. NPDC057668]|uniref:hypothetical protein n=1 Tax=Nocardia sp. NPDC057668 TaxID=3346202 RepID=UPI00366BE06C
MLYVILWLAPLVSWALIARTWRGRITGLGVLGLLAGGQLVMWQGWVGREYQLTSLAVLTGVIMFVAVIGPVVDIFRASPPPRSAHGRMALGWLLNAGYCVLCGLILLTSATVVGMFGRMSWVPGEDALGPLPAGLSVRETVDLGCTARSSASSCDRNFVIDGANSTPDRTAEDVRRHLETTAGWTFAPAKSLARGTRVLWQGACRSQGRMLDRYVACAWVSIKESGMVVVQMSYQDDW